MRRFIASFFTILLISASVLYSQVGNTGRQYTATSPISISGNNISCPTCSTGSGGVNAGTTPQLGWYAATGSTISGLNNYTQALSPDVAPASPNASDDEFNGTSLAGQWTVINAGTNTISFGNSYLTFTGPGQNTNTISGIYESLPASGTWTFVAKTTQTCNAGNARNGMWMMESSSGKAITFDEAFLAVGLTTIFISNWSTTTTITANQLSAADALPTLYLKVNFDGTKINFYFSNSGLPNSYNFLAGLTATTFFTTKPDRIGLEINPDFNSATSQPCFADFDYIRRIN